MANPTWAKTLAQIKPYVFKVLTPRGSGTGFQISYTEASEFCGVATALHVIEHAHEWEDPIKLVHYSSGKTVALRAEQRFIFTMADVDLAFILFHKGEIPIQKNSLPLAPADKRLKQGIEMGWCGFPAVAPNDLCFFTGCNSSWWSKERAYLVDGVAINGVSGGPAFTIRKQLCGVVSAYIPNRATGEALPGVCVIRSVAPYRGMLQSLKSLEEAREKAEEESGEKAQKEAEETAQAKTITKKRPSKKKTVKKKTRRKKAKKI